MKTLFLVQKEQRAILERLYDGIAHNCCCDTRWLDREEQANLRSYFNKNVDMTAYERIVFFLRFKQEIRQVPFIRSVQNLVILEHDAYQNYIPCKYTGKFSKYYSKLPWARIISSGYKVTKRLQQEGYDAVFVPKGYDQTLLHDLKINRDIELAFLGSTKSAAYSGRKALLEELSQVENLIVTRTNSGEDYLNTMNRIKFFVSADVGMGEYMIKNFEAMACGCVLISYDQGQEENNALGFEDMKNLVLYKDIDELRSKLNTLRTSPYLANEIANNGRQLVERRFTFERLGADIVEAMRPPLREAEQPGWISCLRNKLGI